MNLNSRRTIQIELSEFLLRSLQQRVAESNRQAPPEERVALDDVIEWYLASPITIADVPRFETVIPGFTDALNAWLNTITYDPQ